jgi:DNA-binding Lrp family transcriptional regulator
MTIAFVFIECARGVASTAEHAIRQVHGVLEAHSVKNGTDYDLLVKVKTEDDRQFKTAITTLKNIAGVAAIAVSIVYAGTQY